MLVIDPYVFLAEGISPQDRLKVLKENLRSIIALCRKIPCKATFDRIGWQEIERQHIRPLTSLHQDHDLNTALTLFRNQHLQPILHEQSGTARTWGIKPLFGGLADDTNIRHAGYFVNSLLYCLHKNGKAFVYSFDQLGRNLKKHQVGHSCIFERTRWRIYVSSTGLSGAQAVPCVNCIRHLEVGWTCRYDTSLPDCGKHAFVPPADWHLKRTLAVSITKSKPVFLDCKGNGWASPNTPGESYHWDVYISKQEQLQSGGLAQINVCKFGIPSNQGQAGEIHHVPKAKKQAAQF